jgi:hypothetical protein
MRVIRTRRNNREGEEQEEEMHPICEVNKQLNKRMSEAFPLQQSVPTQVSKQNDFKVQIWIKYSMCLG